MACSDPTPPAGSSRYVDGVLVTEMVGPESRLTNTDDYIVRRDTLTAIMSGVAAKGADLPNLISKGERYLRTGKI